MRSTYAVLIALASLSLLPNPLRADILRPVEGGEIVVSTTRDGATLVLNTPSGLIRFPAADFREVIVTPNPKTEWAARAAKANMGGAPERCAAALWALDHGLVAECDAMIRSAHAADSTHQPSSRMVTALDRLKVESPDPDLTAITHGLPRNRRIARGPHIILMHEHPDDEATERVSHLETVVTAYALYFASLGFDLPAPKTRLASMWFAHKDAYVAYLRAEGATSFLTTRGYHLPTRDLVVAYDCRDDPARLRGQESILAARSELDGFARKVAAIPSGARARLALRGKTHIVNREAARELLAQLQREVDRQQIAADLSSREIDWGVAAHETVHQLVEATRLAPRQDRFPGPISEGIAMQFEAIAEGHWAGLAGVPSYRLRDYRSIPSPPNLTATLVDARFGPGYNPDAYARAWAATFYLRRERPRAFIALIDELRAPPEQSEAITVRATKILAKNLPGAVDDDWHGWMERLRLPSEPPEQPQRPH